jgi:putative heme-binding domain-containing protein
MQALKDKEVDDLLGSAWGRTRPTPKELETAIDTMRGELAKGGGSFAKGKAVFAVQCQKCHQFDGAGATVGPPLDGAGRDIEYILANVIDPNRVIGAPYFQRIVTLADGRVEQGVLAEEDDQSVTLKVENGVQKKFARADLDGPVKVVERSLMPEGLAYGMGVQDFRDLTVYLMANPYPAAVTVGDKPVSVPVTGLIPLPAGDGKPVTVTLKVSASAPVSTVLAVGSADPFTVSVNGKLLGEGRGAGQRPDAERLPLALAAGDHSITVTLKWSGRTQGVYVRVLDPDRKLVP